MGHGDGCKVGWLDGANEGIGVGFEEGIEVGCCVG